MGDLAFLIALAVMVGLNLYFGPRIKGDRIAMQWSFRGKPTWSRRSSRECGGLSRLP
jgi:hypothetical protein